MRVKERKKVRQEKEHINKTKQNLLQDCGWNDRKLGDRKCMQGEQNKEMPIYNLQTLKNYFEECFTLLKNLQ